MRLTSSLQVKGGAMAACVSWRRSRAKTRMNASLGNTCKTSTSRADRLFQRAPASPETFLAKRFKLWFPGEVRCTYFRSNALLENFADGEGGEHEMRRDGGPAVTNSTRAGKATMRTSPPSSLARLLLLGVLGLLVVCSNMGPNNSNAGNIMVAAAAAADAVRSVLHEHPDFKTRGRRGHDHATRTCRT